MTARGLCAVVLAAGAGTRLRPLTDLLPKALCPVGNVTLLDRALNQLETLGLSGPDLVAVNAHHHADQVVAAVAGRATGSVEQPEALGTAGAIAALRDWVSGRDVLVINADAYLAGPLPGEFLGGWSGERPRLLVVEAGERRRDFDEWRFAGISLLPATEAARLRPEPTGLYEVVWRAARAEGHLELTPFVGTFVDCGTPTDYLTANLHARTADASDPAGIDPSAVVTGEVTDSVVGAGAVVEGRITRCVVWPGARVEKHETLTDVVRAGDGLTVPA
ncbi:sugar phosphate nucleotidyltransferase [Cryptosporangium arvum]|uniref:Nucleoside-diphosphate-sugar pyrophosphorylase family protein n=1 Tax=Cryptosporangium arvum DSM 44712 TaxID=927661 RepID=A0A010ZUJ9_9ACTN|nr:sugar phosphate nucleotidyltransferase [Cryptosporangium arvum]EXG80872.1 Nucleoside-diphosphate-sugar pyrophosphorylase family protein [Cryptosporangium arvum DSM 44712]